MDFPGPSNSSASSSSTNLNKSLPPDEPKVMESLKNYSLKRSINVFDDSWLHKRELGMKRKLGTENQVQKSLYSALTPIAKWGDMKKTGGIFNLEFSEDGSLLVAACEKKCVYMFDPLSKDVIGSIPDAHTDCVNYVRFLDSRVFATCSDDTTIALWDARNLKSRIRTLQGHSNWVKNIEFSSKDDLLVTSGFDGSIYTWDINNYTETGFVYNRVFQTNGLMRMKLTPDGNKMIMCTTAGYLILIHDLNLATLSQDLLGFKPNMYRLMQLSDTVLPMASEYHYLFSKGRKRNRVEFITDFPFGDEAEVVSSLQIHPQGWCALSRNISNSERSEWTCVHDIQEYPHTEDEDDDIKTGSSSREDTARRSSSARTSESQQHQPAYQLSNTTENRYPQLEITEADIWEALLVLREARSANSTSRNFLLQDYDQGLRIIRISSGLQNPSSNNISNNSNDEDWETESNSGHNSDPEPDRSHDREDPLNISDTEDQETTTTGRTTGNNASQTAPESESQSERNSSGLPLVFRFIPNASGNSEEVVITPSHTTDRSNSGTTTATPGNQSSSTSTPPTGNGGGRRQFIQHNRNDKKPKHYVKPKKSYVQNKTRLTHYIEELNVGRGYIKELCFSSNGRLICSPFSFGVRLFSFNEDCAHMSACVPHNIPHAPTQLYELTSSSCHSDIVLSTKFSPKHDILVSGCLNGRIVLHQPVF